MSKELVAITMIMSYVITGCIYFYLTKKTNLKKEWMSFIPFGAAYQRIRIANLTPKFLWLHIIISVIGSLQYFIEPTFYYWILPFLLANLAISIWIDWRVVKAFDKPGYICLINLVPDIGPAIYLVFLTYLIRDEDTFYLDPDKPKWLE